MDPCKPLEDHTDCRLNAVRKLGLQELPPERFGLLSKLQALDPFFTNETDQNIYPINTQVFTVTRRLRVVGYGVVPFR